MKPLFSALVLVFTTSAAAQFIPQPMGYNPDVNGDAFIGVDDVMGTLALYNNIFDNGDSLNVLSTSDSLWAEGFETFLIPVGTDILYLNYEVALEGANAIIELPESNGFSTLMVLTDPTVWKPHHLTFNYQGDGQESHNYTHNRNKCFIWIHGHNDKWYLVSGPTL